MSGAYSPDALHDCFDTVRAAIPTAQLGGIYANKPGYHNARNQLPSSDYSVQQSYDQKGDGWAAGALDVTLGDADMKKLTQRLIDETKANGDSGRLRGVREFFGTVNGSTVTGMDVPGRYYVTSDPSHLWHVHISGKRQYANDRAAWQDIAAVLLAGTSSGGDTGGDDNMDYGGGYNGNDQALSNSWRTLAIDEDGSQTWKWGPVKFQAQANIVLEGLPTGGQSARFRWAAYDVRQSDGYTKPDPVNAWGDIEVLGTSGSTYTSIAQFGSIGTPPSGYSRRLRMQGYSDAASGAKVTALRWALFSQ